MSNILLLDILSLEGMILYMKNILKIRNISKIYQAKNGEINALDKISFDVQKGEFVSIIGPSRLPENLRFFLSLQVLKINQVEKLL